MAGFAVMHESQEEYDAKIRAKAIEEFADILKAELIYTPVSCEYDYAYEIAMVDARRKVDKIATELKGE